MCLTMALVPSSFGFTKHVEVPVSRAARVVPGGPPSVVDLVGQVGSSVVNVKVTKVEKNAFVGAPGIEDGPFGEMFKRYFGDLPRRQQQFKSRGAGSGVIINADGTILTNNHVVDRAQEIMVTFTDKKEYKARVVGRDPKTDLAVIKIDAKGHFVPARLGDSNGLGLGESVIAVGYPLGLSNSLTAGIISAKGRIIGAGPYDDFIQTDAPINPGNSGGRSST
jgi:serine protease Do